MLADFSQNVHRVMEQTLLLNATYEPLRVVHWQKAITLWCQGKVEIVAHYDREVRSVTFSMKLPSVIRLLRRIRVRRKAEYVPFSRANIYARDHHTCQYCGDGFATVAHVRPRRAGRAGRPQGLGEHRHLLHLVQPEEGRTHARAGRHAAHPPPAATRQAPRAIRITFGLRNAPESWRDYVYWNVELEDRRRRSSFLGFGRTTSQCPIIDYVSQVISASAGLGRSRRPRRDRRRAPAVPADGPPHVLVGTHDAHVVGASHARFVSSCPPRPRAARRPSGWTSCRARRAVPRDRAAARHRAPSGGQPGVRPRRPALCHAERRARHEGAGAAVSLSAATACASRWRSRSPIPPRSRSGPTAPCTSRAGSTGTCTGSPPTIRSRSTRPSSACRRASRSRADGSAVRRRSIRLDSAGLAGSAGRDVRAASGQRRRVPPGDGPGRFPVRHGADARDARSDLPHHARPAGGRRQRSARPAAGAGVRLDRPLYVVDALAGAAGLYKIDVRRHRRPISCSPPRRSSASPSIRRAASFSPRTTRSGSSTLDSNR